MIAGKGHWKQEKKKPLCSEGREELMEEASSFASKDWLDLDRKKKGWGGDSRFGYEERRKLRVCTRYFSYVNEGKIGSKIGTRLWKILKIKSRCLTFIILYIVRM